jgi:hypothetical protein
LLPSGGTVSRAIQGDGYQATNLMVGATIGNRAPTIEIVCTIGRKNLSNQKEKGAMKMSTISLTSTSKSNSLLRLIALGGLITGTAHSIIFHWFVSSVLGGYPLTAVYQYIASGALGESAFAGGIATALLGVLFHFIVSFVAAGVFILSANGISFLRRYAIVGSLLFGFGVFIVMSMIVVPLSAAPPLPAPTTPQLTMNILEHILVIGLPLGILVQRNANTNK